jgi:transposase InsO family protein
MDSMFLVLVCAHSKWPEVIQMKTITSTKTIEALCMIFCRTGIPKQIVSDNGPQFTSGEFENFTKQNGIKNYKSAPFHRNPHGLSPREQMATPMDAVVLPAAFSVLADTHHNT